MASFSERMGIMAPSDAVQVDAMDDSLRNGLWTAFLASFVPRDVGNLEPLSDYKTTNVAVTVLFTEFFRFPLDHVPWSVETAMRQLRELYYALGWNQVYDLVEFVAGAIPDEDYVDRCNWVLERDRSAYRFADKQLVRVTDERDLAAVQRALDDTPGGKLRHVQTHLQTAIGLMSDRENPDFRNSIKESVSAVEGVVNVIVGGKGTLGQAVKKIDPPLHPALAEGLSKLYGWTSDDGGIRHALMDEETVDLEDAQFMLVMCSGFVSFLVAKTARASAI